MTQPFADALTWVPKSRALGTTLAQANDLARARGNDAVTLEHLLQALIEDVDAAPVLDACNIDLPQLGQDVADHIRALPTSDQSMPVADPALIRILEYAVAAAQQSRRREVTGAIVLAAIVGEGSSKAAQMLQARGLTFQDTVRALQRTAQQQPAAPGGASGGRQAEHLPDSPVPETGQAASAPPSELTAPASPPATPPPGAAVAPPAVYPPAPARADVPASEPASEDDPLTAARRRIEAARNGLPLPPAAVPLPARSRSAAAASNGYAERIATGARGGAAAFELSSSDAPSGWAPPSIATRLADGARVHRMPPPMPPTAGHPFDAGAGMAINGAIGGGQSAAPLDHQPAPPPQRRDAPWRDAGLQQTHAPAQLRTVAIATQSFDPESLVESIPERVRVARPVTVEIMIPRAALPSLAPTIGGSVDARTASHASVGDGSGEPIVRLAVSVRLKSLTRGLLVEDLGHETQWLDNRFDPMLAETALWRWTLTPLQRGRGQLHLGVGVHQLGSDGVMVETALPEQTVDIDVTGNMAATGRRWAGFLVAALAGAALSRLFGDAVWAAAQTALARLISE